MTGEYQALPGQPWGSLVVEWANEGEPVWFDGVDSTDPCLRPPTHVLEEGRY